MTDDANIEDGLMEPYTCPRCSYEMHWRAEARGCDRCHREVCIGCIWFHGVAAQYCTDCACDILRPTVQIVSSGSTNKNIHYETWGS